MQLITAFQLANQNDNQLSNLFSQVSREIARTEAESFERAKGLASLENITREMMGRYR